MYGLVSALREHPEIKMIVPRHEQATTYMADGYDVVITKGGQQWLEENGWEVHETDDGEHYFYDPETEETTW